MKKIFFAIIVIILLVTAYFIFYKIDRNKAIKIILKKLPTASKEALEKFDEGYVIEWAKAIRKDSPDFTFNGKIYSTQTGKSK